MRIGFERTLLAAAIGSWASASAPAHAQEFWARTHLVNVQSGTDLSETASALGSGGYELSDGTDVSLRDWYHSDWLDLHVTMLTVVSDQLGIFWGFNTGEEGQKYRIEPGLKLGFILRRDLTLNSDISVSARTILGGSLQERSCTADYGAIGGVQAVNCRLAASPLPPSETLDYLVSEPPENQFAIDLRYTVRF